ncbi:helix-turn-helix domain-containing protein [Heyndrickxia sporothermodurans]|uniref:helix-turn-helix domain-containing protein n=1 Tax=Heyndrickxia sporothermodurans TaxID=46224 RepID=UPI002DBDE8EE|nr:helix-turn-helix domain-containing protein [Heyndrickxia sporothermodurans]MEB6549126.1 helix-turn-helix domain-containing protein [Heyndrickxia sporothermodurans]MED3779352.1 helix-turn-helix domain-containing protein [Heyndrickxia sporothermodurans]
MTIGIRISALRKKKNLTQEELAQRVGISRAALSHYEKDRREPDFETLKKIADFFDVSSDYLISGKESDELINVAGKEIKLTPEEYEVFKELKKHPTAFHDIMSDPERKVKQLIKMWEALNLQLKEIDEDDKDYLE